MVGPPWIAVLGSGPRVDADNRSHTNPLTGKPDAGDPPVRFGGRGSGKPLSLPLSHLHPQSDCVGGYVWNVALGIARPNCHDGGTACPAIASERRRMKRGGWWRRRGVSSPLKNAASRSSRGNEAQISSETEAKQYESLLTSAATF